MNWKRILLGLFLLAGMLGVLALGLSAYVVSSTRARVLEAEAQIGRASCRERVSA